MKSIVHGPILASLLFVASALGQDRIPWASDFRTACELAAEQKRLVLLHFYGDHCEPCVRVERNVFTQPKVADAVAQNYVPVKVHAGNEKELANRYQVFAWPTDVIVTPSGLEVFRTVSPKSPSDYISFLNQVALQTGTSSGRQWVSPLDRLAAEPGNAAASPALAAGWPASGQAQAGQAPASPFAAAGNQPSAAVGSAMPQTNAWPPSPQPQFNSSPTGSMAMAAPQMAMAGVVAPPAGNLQLVPASEAPPMAMDGFCPVTLVETVARNAEDRSAWKKGDPKYGAVHRGRTYLFASQDNQEKFLRNPDSYAPVLSGYDAVRYAERGEWAEGKRAYGVLTPDQRIFLFADEESFNKFSRSPGSYAAALRQAMLPGQGENGYR